jgi:hypothetical protein
VSIEHTAVGIRRVTMLIRVGKHYIIARVFCGYYYVNKDP